MAFLLHSTGIRVTSKESSVNKMHTVDNTKISQNMKDVFSKLVKEITEAELSLCEKVDKGEIKDDFSSIQWTFFQEIAYFYYNLADNGFPPGLRKEFPPVLQKGGFPPKLQKEFVNLFNLLENSGATFTKVELFHILVCTTFPPLEVYSEDSKMDCVSLYDFSYFLLSNVPREDFLYHLKEINTNNKKFEAKVDFADSAELKKSAYEALAEAVHLQADFELKLNLVFSSVEQVFEGEEHYDYDASKDRYISKDMIDFIEEYLEQLS